MAGLRDGEFVTEFILSILKVIRVLLQNLVDTEGPPLMHNGSEEEQRSLDSTCRRVRRFVTHTGPARPLRWKKGKRQAPRVGGQRSQP